jgi:hypothetical protein
VINLCELYDSRPLDISCIDSAKDFASFNPHQYMLDAIDAMGSLILLYQACHGWEYVPCVMEHYCCMVGLHAATKIHTSERWLDILSACVHGLWHMSRSWRLSRPLLRTIDHVLKSVSNASSLLPSEVVNILQRFEGQIWSNDEITSLSANYVVHQIPDHLTRQDKTIRSSRAEGIENLILMLEQTHILQAT